MGLLTREIRTGVMLAGRYRVRRRLGAGGMATVFLAEDERLGREVAIKRLHTDAPEASLRRFEQEARLGAALNHPNLVSIWDTAVTEEGALIVMEYVPGRPLGEVAGGRPMRPSRALPILRDVASALDHAHANEVVHRDVKPGNIIVGDDGVVKLADLGIAKAVGSTQITMEGSVVGTLPYMSPERLHGPGAGGPESDIYALAAVAFELLSGRPPAQPADTEEAAVSPPRDLRREWPEGPPSAVRILERALSDDPSVRQASAVRMIEELEAALKRGGTPIQPTRRMAAAGAPPARGRRSGGASSVARRDDRPPPVEGPKRRFSPGWALGAALVAMLILAGAVSALTGGGGDDEPRSAADGKQNKQAKSEPTTTEQQEPVAVAPEPKPEPEPAQPATPAATPSADGRSAYELNAEGYELMQQGRFAEAIPLLEEAVAQYPEGSTDLTYAYALFNLGSSLRQAGRPDEAISVLERRLEIPNQQGTVMQELEAARAAAG
ncbi:MAG: serine/threonine protein kinase [Solirubrobacterales bacterium]|nr:serine/threonine protein kinase [Solirubrobacterales bacterium]